MLMRWPQSVTDSHKSAHVTSSETRPLRLGNFAKMLLLNIKYIILFSLKWLSSNVHVNCFCWFWFHHILNTSHMYINTFCSSAQNKTLDSTRPQITHIIVNHSPGFWAEFIIISRQPASVVIQGEKNSFIKPVTVSIEIISKLICLSSPVIATNWICLFSRKKSQILVPGLSEYWRKLVKWYR